MAKTLQHRRDTTSNLASVSGSIGEFFMDTTKNTLVVMDGSTNGGHPLQLELVSGTTIKTVNGTSLLGSGNITISGGSADFSAVAEDVLPSLDAVYDLGSSTKQWYDLFVSNSVTIDGGSLTGNATGLVTSTMLIGDLLVTTNTITPDASTALQYNGDQGVVDILGNLDVSAGDWLLPAVVETVSGTPPLTTGTEGAVRYNKDVGELQLYTDEWTSISIERTELITADNFSTARFVEKNKKYLVWTNLNVPYMDHIKLPVTGLEVGDTIEFICAGYQTSHTISTIGNGNLILPSNYSALETNPTNYMYIFAAVEPGPASYVFFFVWNGTYWLSSNY